MELRDRLRALELDVDVERAVLVGLDREPRALDAERGQQLGLALERRPARDCLSIRPNPDRCPRGSTSIGTVPIPVSSRTVALPSAEEIAKALPRVGWPANESSLSGVKIRIRASPSSSGGRTKTVSERFISRASACISPGLEPAPVGEDRELIALQRRFGEDVEEDVGQRALFGRNTAEALGEGRGEEVEIDAHRRGTYPASVTSR